jgi:hypothetical protein
MLAAVAGEVTVVAINHRQADTHEAREVEGGDAGPAEGRERMAQVVRSPQRIDPRCPLRGLPVPSAEVVQVEIPPRGAGNKRARLVAPAADRARPTRSPAAAPRACSGASSCSSNVRARTRATRHEGAICRPSVGTSQRSRLRLADPHFQPGTRPACSIHLCISGPCASSRVFTLT